MNGSKENLEDYLSEKETEIINNVIKIIKRKYPNACKVRITKVMKVMSTDVNYSSHLMIKAIPIDTQGNSITDCELFCDSESFLTTEMFTSLNTFGLNPYEQFFCGLDWDKYKYTLEYDEDSHKLYLTPYWKDAQKVVIKSSPDTNINEVNSAAQYISSSWNNIGSQYVSKIDTMMDVEEDESGKISPIVITTIYLKVLQALNLDVLDIK